MLAIWIIYLVTSIISIDYIMLAMLGWVCAGALVANGNQVDFDNLKINKNFKIYNKPYRFKLLTLITILLALAPTVYLIPFLSNEKRVFDLISRIPKSISKIEMQSNIEKLTFVAENTGQLELRLVIIDYLGYAGANDSVIKLSKLSIVDNPKSFWAWEFLARALESKGMPEEALKARIKTLELDPLNQLIRSRLPENQRN
jgi:hypothetical protein